MTGVARVIKQKMKKNVQKLPVLKEKTNFLVYVTPRVPMGFLKNVNLVQPIGQL